METNETVEHADPGPGLVLTFEAQGYLREAGKWAYFLGIIGFIFTGFIVLAAFFAGAMFTMMAKLQPDAAIPAGIGGFMSFLYILIAVFYFFFSFYLYQFGYRIKRGLMYNDVKEVTNATGKLKSFFKMWGITTIVILCFYVLVILIFIVIGVGAASLMHH
jgi:hypothetical protein